jgi:hypothetical protein
MLKIIIFILLIGVIISLFSGLVFLVKDKNDSKRLACSLPHYSRYARSNHNRHHSDRTLDRRPQTQSVADLALHFL